MREPYSQYFANARGSHYIALAKGAARTTNGRMTLDDSFRRHLAALIDEKADGNVNAVAKAADVREGTIRAILDGTTQSTRLATIDKLAEGFGVSPGTLLGTEAAPLNYPLLQKVLEKLLRAILPEPKMAPLVARSVLRAYEVGVETGVNPDDPQDVEKITRSEARQLRDATRRPVVAK